MKNTCTFFLFLLLISTNLKPVEANSEVDTLFRNSIRFGFEVSYPLRSLLEPEIKQYEASVDFEILKNWFGVIEAGMLKVNVLRDDFYYYSDGVYFRTGVDFNVMGKEALKDNDIVYVGIRYGYSKQNHNADNIFLSDAYWGRHSTSIENFEFGVHWGELVAGMKTELFANLFIGWSLRFRLSFSGYESSLMEPYRIGGFGPGNSNTTFDFNYSVFYRIPF